MTETEKLRSMLNRARERMAYNFDRYACAACAHGVSKNECGCGFKRTGEMIDEIDKMLAEPPALPAPGSPAGMIFMQRQAAMAELDEARKENTRLRGLLADANIPCIYCKLPKDNIKLCPRGFPGCGRMDDLIEGGHV